jgi:hypothetical protein
VAGGGGYIPEFFSRMFSGVNVVIAVTTIQNRKKLFDRPRFKPPKAQLRRHVCDCYLDNARFIFYCTSAVYRQLNVLYPVASYQQETTSYIFNFSCACGVSWPTSSQNLS